MSKILRRITLLGATGKLRTAKYEDREHIVVPVVALMEGVIWPSNAESPEFVPAEVLAVAPGGWNGRPCFVDHPQVDGMYVSGNHPAILPSNFGMIFNAAQNEEVRSSKKLTMEAWLDVVKAESLGEKATSVITRLQAGEVIEVSTGVLAVSEASSGEYNGKRYTHVWREAHADHLAFLSEGDLGACSVEMGCGAPRVATVHLVTSHGLRANVKEADVPMIKSLRTRVRPTEDPKTLRQKLLSLVGRTEEEPYPFLLAEQRANTTVMKLMQDLDAQLRATEPGYIFIEDVDLDAKTVQYTCSPENDWLTYQRTYKLRGESITLNEDRVQVEAVTRYEPVEASSATTINTGTTASCGCQAPAAPAVTALTEETTEMKKKADIIAGLITSGRFKEAQRATLEATDLQVLEALDAQTTVAETPEQKATREAAETAARLTREETARLAAQAAAKPKTLEQYVSEAPEEVRDVLNGALATAKARKSATISALKASNRCDIPDAELQASTQSQLDRLAKLAGLAEAATDFSLIGVPRVSSESDTVAPPKSFHESVKANRAARVQ